MTFSAGSSAGSSRSGAPAPLLVAASLVAVEAVILLLLGVAEMASLTGSRLVMGLTTTVFFLVYGAGLAFCAWALSRLHSWARSPIVLAQLIQLGVAWSFREAPGTLVAAALAGVALLVLVGVLHPASTAALADEPDGAGGSGRFS